MLSARDLKANMAADFRRYFRPFFIDPKTQKSTSYKIYYDIFSFVVTQTTFAFATTPFLVLGFSDSMKVWSRVYFYPVVGVVVASAFFASPGKVLLKKKIEERNNEAGVSLKKTASTESLATGGSADREPLVGPGLTSDVNRELGQMVDEARQTWQEKEKLKAKLSNGAVKGNGALKKQL